MNIDNTLRRLSQSANKGRLWLSLAAAGVLVPGPTRRAAIRGVGSLAASSAVVNIALKPLFRRRRPALEDTPVIRRLTRQPHTTSFPSGHAASAAAFATGVMLERPRLGLAVAPLAAAVAYSRVHTGVHYRSDVLVGASVGAGIAFATRAWWPARPQTPARVRTVRTAPALPRGRGLVVAVNPRSGSNGDPSDDIRRLLPEARLLAVTPELDLAATLSSMDGVGALGVAGGDGTVGSVAAIALEHGLPLAVFPCGTLNHFARDIGVENLEDVRDAVETGTAVAVDVASAGGVPFVNTASIGGYPEMVRRRALLEGRLGKWLAMAVAAGQVLRTHQPLRVLLDGVPADVWLLFVGNSCYVPRGTFPSWRPRLDDGVLDIQYLTTGRLSRTRAVAAILVGTAPHSHVHRTRMSKSLTVTSRSGRFDIACDGEPIGSFTECEFTKSPGALTVYRPRRAPATRD